MATKLRKLGFTAAANEIDAKESLRRKLSLAYEHFRYVTPTVLDRFQQELRTKTERGKRGVNLHVDQLVFDPVATSRRIPPADVLAKMDDAKKLGCFDDFEVAHIQTVDEDPILFGVVRGCPDRFFIAQWDNDVKIEDILKDGEG